MAAGTMTIASFRLRTASRATARLAVALAKAVGMHDERHTAVRTLDRAAALTTEHGGGQSPPVQQDERLMVRFEALGDGILQCATQNHVGTVLGVFLPHVDDRYRRERPILDSPLHEQPRISRARRIVAAFERRRGRAEHDERAFVPAAHHGHIARVITWRFFLLE